MSFDDMMASRDQDEKILLMFLGVAIVGLLTAGFVFGVANGVASGIAGFLYDAGLPEDMAVNVYKMVRSAIVGTLGMGVLAGVVALVWKFY
ncbi:hypothetical protein NGM10_05145 [Halorussus salilacus]|uniref:hypothetical protein n=1 Tax=Halorussus salilacus TaxID=2953750 RepID=UPI0020A1AF1D|nr:hypothetical protein [Halorussus salilacus]USZ69125.1 hypothetical protein NGM10_05145 [Halorussus salilacus]